MRKKTEEEKKFNENIGARIKLMFDTTNEATKNITQQQFAVNIGLKSRLTLRDYFNGKEGLTAYRLSLIINSLNLSDSEILSLFKDETATQTIKLTGPILVEKPLPFPDAESKESCEILTEAVKYKDNNPLVNKTYEIILLLLRDLKKDIATVKKANRGKKRNTA